jgi:micrococcal nuclease
MFEYMAKVVSVYDGDTIRVDIDLGFGIKFDNQSIRLLGINTPEVRGDEREAGLIVRDFVREQILEKNIILKTYRDSKGKYGRWLGQIYYTKEERVITASDSPDALTCLNDELLKLGMAEEM